MVFFAPILLIDTAIRGTTNPVNNTFIVCAIEAVPLFQPSDLIIAGKIIE
jgi:hypothetical protein